MKKRESQTKEKQFQHFAIWFPTSQTGHILKKNLMHDKLDGNTKVQQNEMKIYCCLVLDTHGMAT